MPTAHSAGPVAITAALWRGAWLLWFGLECPSQQAGSRGSSTAKGKLNTGWSENQVHVPRAGATQITRCSLQHAWKSVLPGFLLWVQALRTWLPGPDSCHRFLPPVQTLEPSDRTHLLPPTPAARPSSPGSTCPLASLLLPAPAQPTWFRVRASWVTPSVCLCLPIRGSSIYAWLLGGVAHLCLALGRSSCLALSSVGLVRGELDLLLKQRICYLLS